MSTTTNFTCPADYRNVTKTPAAVFENTRTIVTGHQATPRFGHSNNITQVFTGNKSDVNDYVVGLFGAAILMFSFFAVWFAVIVALKCMGYRLVGFMSGSNVRTPAPPPTRGEGEGDDDDYGAEAGAGQQRKGDDALYANADGYGTSYYDEDYAERNGLTGEELEEWKAGVAKRERRIRNIRIAVIVSGLIIVVMSVLMVVFGLQSLNRSVSDGQSGLTQGSGLATEAVSLIDTYLQRQNATVEAARNVLEVSNETLCPAVKTVLCSDPTVFDCNAIFNTFPQILDYKDLVVEQLVSTRGDLLQVSNILNDVNSSISQFDWAFWVATGCVLLMAVCTLLILNGVILAWQKKLRGTCWQRTTSCLRGWFIVPLFVVLLILGWVFSMVFVVGSTATADFCYNSPNQNVLVRRLFYTPSTVFAKYFACLSQGFAPSSFLSFQAFLDQNKEKFSSNSIIYPTLVYYISGCPNDSLIQTVAQQIAGILVVYLGVAKQALTLLDGQSALLASACNTDPETLRNALVVLQSQSCTIASTIFDVLDFFTCANFNGLYATVAYDAVCYNGNTGFVWISSAQFVILLCAMIMLTLRVAFYELVDESELVQPRGCCSCRRGSGSGDAEDVGNRVADYEDDDLRLRTEDSKVAIPASKNADVNRSLDSGDGFDDMVTNAVARAFDEDEHGNALDGNTRKTQRY